jgi:hypothetical protein
LDDGGGVGGDDDDDNDDDDNNDFRVPYTVANFLASLTVISFSRRAVLC